MVHSMPYLKDTILFKLVDQSCLSTELLYDAVNSNTWVIQKLACRFTVSLFKV